MDCKKYSIIKKANTKKLDEYIYGTTKDSLFLHLALGWWDAEVRASANGCSTFSTEKSTLVANRYVRKRVHLRSQWHMSYDATKLTNDKWLGTTICHEKMRYKISISIVLK